MTTGTIPLSDLVRNVAALRRTAATTAEQIKAIEARVKAENHLLYEEKARLATELEAAESQLRALAKEEYERTGEKKPTPGVEIKIGTSYEYKPEDALAWARQTKMALVPESLDVKAFAKIAAATPLPFVTVVETPKAQIATDLDKVLGAAA